VGLSIYGACLERVIHRLDVIVGVVYFDSVTRNAAIKEGEYFVGLAKDGAGMFGAEKWSSAFVSHCYLVL